jgi:hypothetical protein
MKKWGIMGLILLLTFLTACKAEEPIIPEEETPIEIIEEETPEIEEESREGQALNPLTGLWIDEEIAQRRPVGIMINNLKPAIPQSGIDKIDVLYETLVEGGITRLFGIYQEFDYEKIGPVRSAIRLCL